MTHLLILKEQINKFYGNYGVYLEPIIKFLTALFVFNIINAHLGFNSQLSTITVVLILSVVCAVLPYGAITVIAGALAVGQVFAVSAIVAGVILVIYCIMYCLGVRYSKKFGNLLLAVPILYVLKIPYVVPILMGMIGTPIVVLPISCGVILYYMFCAIKNTASVVVGTSVEESLTFYKLVVDNAMANYEFVFFVVLFAVVVFITYFIRKRTFNYAFEIGIASGTIACILGSLIGTLTMNISSEIILIILGSSISGFIVYIICSFCRILDYTTIEHLQFEDDDYYYYVKAVPKAKITAPEKNVKRINSKKTQDLQSVEESLQQTNEQQELDEKREQEDNFRQKTYNSNLDYMEFDRNDLEK